ncbi:MAG: hypothetical protein HDR20_04290 [Lachnospiraceae bacterium]|nr:hypothetical protein [Lachnospiraceae bacterium]
MDITIRLKESDMSGGHTALAVLAEIYIGQKGNRILRRMGFINFHFENLYVCDYNYVLNVLLMEGDEEPCPYRYYFT